MKSSKPQKPVVIIAGPTASGKSALAVAVAREFGGVVINADSMQVYGGLRVLTARPDAGQQAAVPHRLFGVMDGAEPCGAGRWLALAVAEIAAARAAGLMPVVCGGTGLYLKALMEGLSPVPEIPERVRAAARARFAELGAEGFVAALRGLDPQAADSLPAGDRQRLIRAYEVADATGRTLGQWQQRDAGAPPVAGPFGIVLLLPPRQVLYAAIEARFEAMLKQGGLDEVGRLAARRLAGTLPVMKALGVPELIAYLAGRCTLAEAKGRAKQASRNYAKRQFTWFRNQIRANLTITEQYSERNLDEIFSYIRQNLLTPLS